MFEKIQVDTAQRIQGWIRGCETRKEVAALKAEAREEAAVVMQAAVKSKAERKQVREKRAVADACTTITTTVTTTVHFATNGTSKADEIQDVVSSVKAKHSSVVDQIQIEATRHVEHGGHDTEKLHHILQNLFTLPESEGQESPSAHLTPLREIQGHPEGYASVAKHANGTIRKDEPPRMEMGHLDDTMMVEVNPFPKFPKPNLD